MRIAIVTPAYPPSSQGGTATQAAAKAHGLAALGHEVHVIAPSDGTGTGSTADGPVTLWETAPVDRRLTVTNDASRWVADSVEIAARVEQVDAEVGLDVVEFAEWASQGFVHLLNRTPWHRLPTVVHVHGPLAMLAGTIGWPEPGSPLEQVGRFMEGTCLRMADGVYASAATSADWCASAHGLDRTTIPVWHSGVDTTCFEPDAARRRREPTIVAVGRLDASKGVDELVEAAIGLAGEIPDLRLRIIGPGTAEQERRLHARCADAGHPDLLETPGRVDRNALPGELAAAHVFALPSWYEGGPGLAYLEAMSSGLPVIAPAGSGVSEIVEHGVTGLLVPPRQVAPLHAALREVLTTPALADRLGRAARDVCVERHDTAERMPWLASYLKQVVDEVGR